MNTKGRFTDEDSDQNHVSISESSENVSITDSESNLNFNVQNPSINTKPTHWTEAYWQTITSHYKWFIHIDGNGGCIVCFSNKASKKSLLASMKLKLMNLSYDEFEKKLIEHSFSNQHQKSISNCKGICNQSNVSNKKKTPNTDIIERTLSERDTKRIFPFDFQCSMCKKGYKSKKSLAKHIFLCNPNNNSKGFTFPCSCVDCVLHSIIDIDVHNTIKHNSTYRFNCKLCNEQHKSAKVFYGHMLIDHDCIWNPYEEMPFVLVTLDSTDLDSRSERRRTSSNQIYCELEDHINGDSKVEKKRRPNNKIEKITSDDKRETSHLKLSLDQIDNCEFCGGRYLSNNILYEHVKTRHAALLDGDEMLKSKYQKMYLNNIIASTDKLESENSTAKNCSLTKKYIDEKTTCIHDNQISACLLTCPLCQKCFSNLDARKNHVSQYHPEIQQFVCQHCGLIFTNHTNYNRHLEKSHNCISLSKPSKSSLIINYSCSFCPLVFTNQADLSNHFNLSHQDPVVKPVVIVKEDIIEAPPKVTEVIAVKNGQSDTLLRGLLEADPTESRCVCLICDTQLHNAYEYAVHCLSHNDGCKEDINLQSCPNCSRLFFGQYSKMYLKDHYNVEHLKKASPSCPICKTSFTSTFTYDRHRSGGVCHNDDNVFLEPYAAFMTTERVAFSCSQCGVVLAGDSANDRLEIHTKTCTSDLMDDDEFLD